MRAGGEIRPVRAAGSGWIVKDRTPGRRGFRRPRDESNPVGGGARLNGRIFSPAGARRHCPGFKGARRWGAGRQARSRAVTARFGGLCGREFCWVKVSRDLRRDAQAQNDAGGSLAVAEGGVVEAKVCLSTRPNALPNLQTRYGARVREV